MGKRSSEASFALFLQGHVLCDQRGVMAMELWLRCAASVLADSSPDNYPFTCLKQTHWSSFLFLQAS